MNLLLSSNLYPLMFSLALLAGLWICETRSRSPETARRIYLVGSSTGLVGARLWYGVEFGHFGIFGGLSIWGFMMGAALGVAGYLRWRPAGGSDLADFTAAAAPALAFGSALQRIGCFFAGCCFGKASSLPWALSFRPGTPVFRQQVIEGILDPSSARTLPVHPTQLYSSGAMILAFFALLWVAREFGDRLLRYELFLGLAVYGGAFRFLIEYLRGDTGGRYFGPLTFAQGSSLAVFLAAAALLVYRRLHYPPYESRANIAA